MADDSTVTERQRVDRSDRRSRALRAVADPAESVCLVRQRDAETADIKPWPIHTAGKEPLQAAAGHAQG